MVVTMDAQATLAAMAEGRGTSLAALSRMIGRNPAYLQQFVKRGTPRRLDEAARRHLAAFFGVDESLLGGPARDADMVAVQRIDAHAAAGPGGLVEDDRVVGEERIDPRVVSRLGVAPGALTMITARGESMEPLIHDGDALFVDTGDQPAVVAPRAVRAAARRGAIGQARRADRVRSSRRQRQSGSAADRAGTCRSRGDYRAGRAAGAVAEIARRAKAAGRSARPRTAAPIPITAPISSQRVALPCVMPRIPPTSSPSAIRKPPAAGAVDRGGRRFIGVAFPCLLFRRGTPVSRRGTGGSRRSKRVYHCVPPPAVDPRFWHAA